MSTRPDDLATPAIDGLSVNDQQLRLPAGIDPAKTYDVLINDHHVWSLLPERDTKTVEGSTVARWPKVLRRFLRGRAEVLVREHVSQSVIGTTQHAFAGDSSIEVTIVDSSGERLVVDKWGRLIRPLANAGQDIIDELMDEVDHLLQVLRDEAGVPAFISYGTLLGAVRNGKLIGHDNDIDLAYVSELPHPVDVVREAYRVERALKSHGWTVRRGSGARINVRLRLSDGTMRAVDVFTAHWVEGVLYIPSDTGFRLPRETILPLTTVELLGRELPAPAQSEALLAATYGENWHTPDPSFQYETPRGLARRLNGWFGGLISHRKHWDSFYAGNRKSDVPKEPTPFARWVADSYPSAGPLVDVGSGTGRDALWFARTHGRRVVALDYCLPGLNAARRRARNQGLGDLVSFEPLNLYDTRAVLALGARLGREPDPADLFVRFTLHALKQDGQDNLLRLASMALRRGGHLFLEFRTLRDRARPKAFGDHVRHYQSSASVVRAIENAGGRVIYRTEDIGLAPFPGEDPHVCRLVATWSGEQPAAATRLRLATIQHGRRVEGKLRAAAARLRRLVRRR